MAVSVPGNSCRSCGNSAATTTGCQFRLPGQCVYYSGANISGPGINTGDSFNTVVTKLSEYVPDIPISAANNGLLVDSNTIQLGGPLIEETTIDAGANRLIYQTTTVGAGVWFQQDYGINLRSITNNRFPGLTFYLNEDYQLSRRTATFGVNSFYETFIQCGPGISPADPTAANRLFVFQMIGGSLRITRNAYLLTNKILAGSVGTVDYTPTASLELRSSGIGTGGAPLKFVSSALLTTAETGAVEFLTDKFYGTITTGSARKEITLNDTALTNRVIPIAQDNGRLTNGPLSRNSSGDTLTLAQGVVFQTNQVIVANDVDNPTIFTYYNPAQIRNTTVGATFEILIPNGYVTINTPRTRVGAAVASVPTAQLHLVGNSTGAAGLAPIKITSGLLMATPENGAIEYDGANLYFTVGSTRNPFVLGATPGASIYTGDGTLGGNRVVDQNGFSLTFDNAALFRIENGDATVGGIYDFNTSVDLLSYDADNSSNLILNPVTGLTFEYVDLTGPTVLSSMAVDSVGVKLTGIQEFADNAAAILGGLTDGYLYRTGDVLKIVHP